jgi:hypothetical protein
MKGGRCHTIDEVYERSNPGWEYVAFGIQSRALLITRRCLMLTRRWGQAWRRPGPWPARRPARLARVAPLVRACALPSRSGSLQPRSPSGATPAPSACIFCVDRTWGRIECLAFLRRYLVEEKAACARPTRPACPAMLGIGAGLACAVWLPSGCRLAAVWVGLAGAGWHAPAAPLSMPQPIAGAGACIVPAHQTQGAGGGGWGSERCGRAAWLAAFGVQGGSCLNGPLVDDPGDHPRP